MHSPTAPLLTTLYVDMNAYFASVEQHLVPSLRGLPIAICPVRAASGCCIAASYEAKRQGVKTGMRVSEAQELCPTIILVEARPKQYTIVHHQVREAVESCAPIDQVCSIDEFACKLWAGEKAVEPATAIARSIKVAIRTRVGPVMRCSIGIGPNRFLAKVAADMQKPDGLTIIEPHTLPYALYHLPLTDLPGIGENMERRLQRAGIETVEQLCGKTRQEMIAAWGSVVGAVMWHNLRGDDLPQPPTKRGSIGHSHVLAPNLRNRAGVRSVLVKLIHRAAERARVTGYTPEYCTVQVSFMDLPRWSRRLYIAGRGGTPAILSAFAPVWESAPSGKPVQAGVVLHDLANAESMTLPLFDEQVRESNLASTMDAINSRFGPDTLYPASMHNARDSAPVRISFTQIPDIGTFGTVGD